MVGCSDMSQLFVSQNSGVIWRVNLQSMNTDRFIQPKDRVNAMSLTARRLLVTSYHSVCVYNINDGSELTAVSLPSVVKKAHPAVELSNETFIVCHGYWLHEHEGVIEAVM